MTKREEAIWTRDWRGQGFAVLALSIFFFLFDSAICAVERGER